MKKVLIVGDFDTFRELDDNILSRDGLFVFTTSSGEQAVEIHKREKVDLIISDLDLPGMGGDDLCNYIRGFSILKNVSTILLCENRRDDLERCIHCGANAVITRPIRADDLNARVSQLLNISERENLRVVMRVAVEGKTGDETFYPVSENISASGMLIRTERVLAKGDIITCTFLLGLEQIVVKGEVARVERRGQEGYLYGVRFVDMNDTLLFKIEEFIRNRLSWPAP